MKLNLKKVDFSHTLEKNLSGCVYPYKGKNDPQGEKAVVKCITLKKYSDLMQCFSDVIVGFDCKHSSIIPILGYNISQNNQEMMNDDGEFRFFIKMPRIEQNLFDYMKNPSRTNEEFESIVKNFFSLVCGLEYLHSRKIVHRNIKPSNIFIEVEGNFKLSIFGSASVVLKEDKNDNLNEMLNCQMAPKYHPPELQNPSNYKNEEIFYKVDVWNLACLISEFCLPKTQNEELEKDLFLIEQEYGKTLANIIKNMLKHDPNERPSISDVRKELEEKFEFLGNNPLKNKNANSNPKDLLSAVNHQVKFK